MKITSPARRSMRRYVIAAAVVFLILVVGVGGWAATAVISGAVVASGSLVVDTNVKKVQHPTGGIVGELRVRDGDRVHAGDVVARLDETVTRANLAIVTNCLDELMARKARLESERDGWDTIIFPAQLVAGASDPDRTAAMDSERKLFKLRKTARSGQKAQLQERISQLGEEITGLAAQQNSKAKEITLLERELAGVRDLGTRIWSSSIGSRHSSARRRGSAVNAGNWSRPRRRLRARSPRPRCKFSK
jgi:HlyD family secretion protein